MVHYSGGQSGMPIKHMSSLPYENEVLHSGRQMRDGMKITNHVWTNDGKELHLYVDDKRKK